MEDDLVTVLLPERANEEKFSFRLMMIGHVQYLRLRIRIDLKVL